MTTAPTMLPPSDKMTRDAIRSAVREYEPLQSLVPPLSLEELETHAEGILHQADLGPELKGFVTVLVGNQVWGPTVAGTSFERRILLLPQCLKSSKACPAECDELGLLCQECGRCSIGTIQREAEQLGYSVLIAEGTTSVSTLLARGEADAVIGIGCLHALERSFRPLMQYAVPGLAIPLLRNECIDTAVDLDWVRETLRLKTELSQPVPPGINALRREVAAWFEPAPLRDLLCPKGSATETIAFEWMLKGGKRWRPLLAAGVYRALRGGNAPSTDPLRHLAVAVECFHKASLIHDDIEDEEVTRYGEPALHRQHGVAVALNVGDLLIGAGYRLIAECGASPDLIRDMLAVAAEGHRTLCLGQGAELLLRGGHAPVPVSTVLEIFRQKTAPAFNVALQLGAIAACAGDEIRTVLSGFSEATGIAYQIRDDLEDRVPDRTALSTGTCPLSVLGALRAEQSSEPAPTLPAAEEQRFRLAEERARQLLQQYEDAALRELRPLHQSSLKRLLFRVASLIQHQTTPPP